jgi:hypothetical protein
MAEGSGRTRRMWLMGLSCAILAATLLTTVMAIIIGAFLVTLTAWGLLTRQKLLAYTRLGRISCWNFFPGHTRRQLHADWVATEIKRYFIFGQLSTSNESIAGAF